MVRASAADLTIQLSLSTEDGTLVNGGTTGALTFAVPVAQMSRLGAGSYVLDLIAIADGQQINLFLAQPATLTHAQGVTR